MSTPVRRLIVWCPDWPVVAAAMNAGRSPTEPAAVLTDNRVLACSAIARQHGVRRGTRRREAQGRCPELVVYEHDPGRDARLFEPVAAAVESLAPGVEIVRPGLVAVAAKGPAVHFGERAAAEHIVDRIAERAGVECQVGLADGLFAATLAARRNMIVEHGNTREFLAPLDIGEIEQPERSGRARLVDLLRRLGIRTLGEFASLPTTDVATRFGPDALSVHRAARGQEQRPPLRREPPPDLEVTEHLDPPVDRVDAAAFAAKTPAQRLHERLEARGLACIRLGIIARTEHGEELERVWRCAEPLTRDGTADRVRWQLDGWLSAPPGQVRPTAGVCTVTLRPRELVGAGDLQLDLLDDSSGRAAEHAGRAFVRVQGMLGPDGVLTGVFDGGRDERDRIKLVPWGDRFTTVATSDQPWPGALPAPSPSSLPESPWPADVLDVAGNPVEITERNQLTGTPHRLVVNGEHVRFVRAWAGPWPIDERWWVAWAHGTETDLDRSGGVPPPRRVTRMQVTVTDENGVAGEEAAAESEGGSAGDSEGEVALLLVLEHGRWSIQGVYR